MLNLSRFYETVATAAEKFNKDKRILINRDENEWFKVFNILFFIPWNTPNDGLSIYAEKREITIKPELKQQRWNMERKIGALYRLNDQMAKAEQDPKNKTVVDHLRTVKELKSEENKLNVALGRLCEYRNTLGIFKEGKYNFDDSKVYQGVVYTSVQQSLNFSDIEKDRAQFNLLVKKIDQLEQRRAVLELEISVQEKKPMTKEQAREILSEHLSGNEWLRHPNELAQQAFTISAADANTVPRDVSKITLLRKQVKELEDKILQNRHGPEDVKKLVLKTIELEKSVDAASDLILKSMIKIPQSVYEIEKRGDDPIMDRARDYNLGLMNALLLVQEMELGKDATPITQAALNKLVSKDYQLPKSETAPLFVTFLNRLADQVKKESEELVDEVKKAESKEKLQELQPRVTATARYPNIIAESLMNVEDIKLLAYGQKDRIAEVEQIAKDYQAKLNDFEATAEGARNIQMQQDLTALYKQIEADEKRLKDIEAEKAHLDGLLRGPKNPQLRAAYPIDPAWQTDLDKLNMEWAQLQKQIGSQVLKAVAMYRDLNWRQSVKNVQGQYKGIEMNVEEMKKAVAADLRNRFIKMSPISEEAKTDYAEQIKKIFNEVKI